MRKNNKVKQVYSYQYMKVDNIEIKNLLVEGKLAHLKLPLQKIFVLWENDMGKTIGIASIKKRYGKYYADITFTPIVSMKKIPIDNFYPTLILAGDSIIGMALGIYPNLDENVQRIDIQLKEKVSYHKNGALATLKQGRCERHKDVSIGMMLCDDCGPLTESETYYPHKLINGKHEQRNLKSAL